MGCEKERVESARLKYCSLALTSLPITQKVNAERDAIVRSTATAGRIAPLVSPIAPIAAGSEIAPAPMMFFARLNTDAETLEPPFFTAALSLTFDDDSPSSSARVEVNVIKGWRWDSVTDDDRNTGCFTMRDVGGAKAMAVFTSASDHKQHVFIMM